MKPDQVYADVELKHEDRVIKLRALIDTGASRSVVHKRVADKLKAFIPLKRPYYLKTADKDGKLLIVGYCRVDVTFQGAEIPGGAVFEVAENLREDTELIIGRPEIDSWDIIFTPEGPRPRKVPIEFEIV